MGIRLGLSTTEKTALKVNGNGYLVNTGISRSYRVQYDEPEPETIYEPERLIKVWLRHFYAYVYYLEGGGLNA